MTVYLTTKGIRTVGRKAAPVGGLDAVPMRRSVDLIGLGSSSAYAEIYATQPWIYVLVNKISRAIARLPIVVRATETNEELAVHPLAALIRKPNPRTSRFGLIEHRIGSRAIYGHALTWKYRRAPGVPPEELWPLDWRYITIRETDGVRYFAYDGPAGRKVFFDEDVIYSSWWSPKGDSGTSPLEPLRRMLALEDAGQRYAISSFANAARPAGALVTSGDLDPKERAELRAEIEGAYTGPDNAFRIALLSGGLDWKPFSHTAQEAQTIEHRKLNREEACAVYDIPPPMVHILDRATFSNIDEQHRMLYQDSLGPWFVSEEEDLTLQLVDGEPMYAGVGIAFDLSKILRGDPEKEARAAAQRRSAGITTGNEERASYGLARIDDPRADAILLPLNSVAVAPGLEPDPEQEELDAQTRAMLGLADELAQTRLTADRRASLPGE